MCSKCPWKNCVYVVDKQLGQRQEYTTVKIIINKTHTHMDQRERAMK